MTKETVIETYLINSPRVVAEMLYDTIDRYEKELKKSQDKYNMIWNMYSQLRREIHKPKKSDTYTYKKKEN